jgi:uncharacterized protein YndB with AHSA1/START domain
MNSKNKNKITVQTTVKADLDKVWESWTKPEHITQWNFASEDWCCPNATNDLKSGGKFNWRMEAKNGSVGFDFTGTYDKIIDQKLITYKIEDGRTVEIQFEQKAYEVNVKETFEAEGTNSDEMQRDGWQAILGNFKRYVESK